MDRLRSKRGEDKQNQVYVIAVDGGEARRVTNIPTGVDVPKWFPGQPPDRIRVVHLDRPRALEDQATRACRNGRTRR